MGQTDDAGRREEQPVPSPDHDATPARFGLADPTPEPTDQAGNLLAALLATAAEAILVLDAQDRIVLANDAARRLFARPHAVLTGQAFADFVWAAEPSPSPGGQEAGSRRSRAYWARDHEVFPVEVTRRVVAGSGPARTVAIVRDIRHRQCREAWAQVQIQAAHRLAGNAALPQRLHDLAQVMVPAVADACYVDLLQDGAGVQRAAQAHADGLTPAQRHDLDVGFPPAGEALDGPSRVWRTREPDVVLEAAQALPGQVQAYACMPLWVGERVRGCLTLVAVRSRRCFDVEGLGQIEELARRCAWAIEQVELRQKTDLAWQFCDRLLSFAAHELTEPVTALYLQLDCLLKLARRGNDALPAALQAGLVGLTSQLRRLPGMLQFVTTVYHAANGTLALALAPADLGEIARSAVTALAPALARSQCKIVWRGGIAVTGRWDPEAVAQVLIQLLTEMARLEPGQVIDLCLAYTDAVASVTLSSRGPHRPVAGHDRNQAKTAIRDDRLPFGLWGARLIARAMGGGLVAASPSPSEALWTLQLPRWAGAGPTRGETLAATP